MSEEVAAAGADLALVARLTEERDRARLALARMVQLYMGWPGGYISHEFMSAQEEAIELLEGIGWLRETDVERFVWANTPPEGPKAPAD